MALGDYELHCVRCREKVYVMEYRTEQATDQRGVATSKRFKVGRCMSCGEEVKSEMLPDERA